jgi:hypothetical protein
MEDYRCILAFFLHFKALTTTYMVGVPHNQMHARRQVRRTEDMGDAALTATCSNTLRMYIVQMSPTSTECVPRAGYPQGRQSGWVLSEF